MAIGPLLVLAACDFPVILGQQARRLFEGFGEFAAVFIADAVGNVQDAVIGAGELAHGFGHGCRFRRILGGNALQGGGGPAGQEVLHTFQRRLSQVDLPELAGIGQFIEDAVVADQALVLPAPIEPVQFTEPRLPGRQGPDIEVALFQLILYLIDEGLERRLAQFPDQAADVLVFDGLIHAILEEVAI